MQSGGSPPSPPPPPKSRVTRRVREDDEEQNREGMQFTPGEEQMQQIEMTPERQPYEEPGIERSRSDRKNRYDHDISQTVRGTIIETISPLLRSRSPVPKQKASSPLLPLNEHVTTPKATCTMPSPSGPPVALSPAPSMPSTLPYEDQSPESLASTIPYSPGMQIPVIEEEEVIPYPNNPPTKRTIDESPEGSVPHKTQKATTELGNSATASSSGQNDGKVLLPLKEEESENDEAEPDAMWNQDDSIDRC